MMPHYRLSPSSLLRLMLCALAGVSVQSASALPADPLPRIVVQPDGSKVTVRQLGDEFHHFFITPDSLPLVEQAGYFYYALPQGDALVSTGLRAADAGSRGAEAEAFIAGIDRTATLQSALRQGHTARRQRLLSCTEKPRQGAFPTTGKQRSLAILVTFPQTSASNATTFSHPDPQRLFHDMLNKPGFDTDGATGSVRDYFLDSSSGSYDLTFDVFGPVELEKDISFYGQNFPGGDLNAWNMVIEACQQLDDVIDFTLYDYDKDGAVDNIYVFYAGLGEANGGEAYTVWQHAAEVETIAERQFVFDGMRVNRYACSNELKPIYDAATQTRELHLEGIGVVCHEFTHVLGFPDLYDVESSGQFTPASWSLMDIGSYNNNSRTPPAFSAYERMSMGWLAPQTLSAQPADVRLPAIRHNAALLIPTQQGEGEFFVLENRQKEGWDAYLPGHGMLVWHITYDQQLWDHNRVNASSLQGIDLVEADNVRNEETRDGDAFPGTAGITALSATTIPALTDNAGRDLGFRLTQITEADGHVCFKVNGGEPTLPAVSGMEITDLQPTAFVVRWEACPEATAYEVEVGTEEDGELHFLEAYHPLRTQQTSCDIVGLTPAATYLVRVRALNAEEVGADADWLTVVTPLPGFAYEAPQALVATDISAQGFTARWLPMADAEAYALDVMHGARTGLAQTTVDFTGGIKALPEGWATNCQLTLSLSGAYGDAAPSLSMPTDGSRVESADFADGIRRLSIWIRERNAPCGSNFLTLDVRCGEDAEWQPLDTLLLTETAPASGTTVVWASEMGDGTRTVLLPDACRSFRLTYHRLGSGALALDDVRVEHGGSMTYECLPGFEAVTVGSGCSFPVEGINLSAAPCYYRVYGLRGAERSRASNVVRVDYDAAGMAPPLLPSVPSVWTHPSGRRVVQPSRGVYIDAQGRKVRF